MPRAHGWLPSKLHHREETVAREALAGLSTLLLTQSIRFPRVAQGALMARVHRRFGLPGVCGAIDGCVINASRIFLS
jgi:hypothetical protein